jgi:hypothetical protein
MNQEFANARVGGATPNCLERICSCLAMLDYSMPRPPPPRSQRTPRGGNRPGHMKRAAPVAGPHAVSQTSIDTQLSRMLLYSRFLLQSKRQFCGKVPGQGFARDTLLKMLEQVTSPASRRSAVAREGIWPSKPNSHFGRTNPIAPGAPAFWQNKPNCIDVSAFWQNEAKPKTARILVELETAPGCDSLRTGCLTVSLPKAVRQ